MMSEQTHTAPRPSRPTLRRLRIRVIEGADSGKVIEFEDSGMIAVGSAADNNLVLNDSTVSRYHVELRPLENGIEVVDLGSFNGTHVATLRIERGIVPSGTELRLGKTTLRLEEGAPIMIDAVVDGAPQIEGLVGNSMAMLRVRSLITRLAAIEVSTLILGETGTGKEVVAEAIHRLSSHSGRPFVIVDCGSLPMTLIASELFGHERGAFTGANKQHIGAFERANGGTLFLDEIGELPLVLQPNLLGVLERHSFRRVGGRRDINVNVRVLAATNRDLRAEVNQGRFRADLYYRLAVTRIVIPPLRERTEDIEPLVRRFVRELTGSSETYPLSEETLDSLRRQRWSGNVRELRNIIEASVAMGKLTLDPTFSSAQADPQTFSSAQAAPVKPYREARAEALTLFERTYLKNLNEYFKGNASRAAREARMDRSYLLTLLRRHGLR